MIKVRRGGGEKIPFVQGKGKRLCFAGAAVKIYPPLGKMRPLPATPTILLGFLLPWTWGISSRLLQQSSATAPYLGRGVSSHRRPF